jgi:pyruvate dehydrogenase E1 component beta subunit
MTDTTETTTTGTTTTGTTTTEATTTETSVTATGTTGTAAERSGVGTAAASESPDAPTEMTGREAMRAAMTAAMHADERVFLMGEDVGRYGGCFAVSMGMLEEFGPDRVRDTPLSESAFVGAGIGAALGGMRPIVEIMTVNFSLLAIDQSMNTAATLRHMSGGQFGVPIVIRMTTGGGRQLVAQHSHSLDGWYAHIPGVRIVAPGTVDDFRWMLPPALADPDPVIIFENGALYNASGPVSASDPGLPLGRAAIRRDGRDLTLITFGGTLPTCLHAADQLQGRGIDAEVLDLRSLRPLDDDTIMASIARTHRAVVVDEGWRSVGISGEIAARIMEQAFYELDAPVGRVCTAEVPLPYAHQLELAALPSVDRVVEAADLAMRGVAGDTPTDTAVTR